MDVHDHQPESEAGLWLRPELSTFCNSVVFGPEYLQSLLGVIFLKAEMDITALAPLCAPKMHAQTLHVLVEQESSFNPFAIGVVAGPEGARLKRQPKNKAEAVATAHNLIKHGWNISLGLTQVNMKNLGKYKLTVESAFEPCENLRAGSEIFEECFDRAVIIYREMQASLRASLSCYFSGNFTTGYKTGYVQEVVAKAAGGLPVVARTPELGAKVNTAR